MKNKITVITPGPSIIFSEHWARRRDQSYSVIRINAGAGLLSAVLVYD
jgi:hypothetical protein